MSTDSWAAAVSGSTLLAQFLLTAPAPQTKTEKNAEKGRRRLEKAAKGGEDDIDALLASFKLQ